MLKRRNLGHHLFLSIYSAFVLLPFVWLIMGSLKSTAEFSTNPAGLPKSLEIENFDKAWNGVNLSQAMINSSVLCLSGVLGCILAASLASFSVVRIRSRVSGPILALIVAGLMIPVNAAIIPLFVLVSDIGLLNTRIGLILPYIAFNLPFAMLLISAWMQNIPDELFESAKIDGASSIQLFISLALPLSLPILGTVAIITFVNIWNEFLLSLILLTGEKMRTVPLALSTFKTTYSIDRGAITAGVLLSMIPIVIFYLLFHKTIISGISEGGIKG